MCNFTLALTCQDTHLLDEDITRTYSLEWVKSPHFVEYHGRDGAEREEYGKDSP